MPKSKPKLKVVKGWKRIKLTQGKYALVDVKDFEWLSQWKWFYANTNIGYAIRKYEDRNLYMHRVIMNTPKGMDTDHINGNGLDNRRSNLRVVTHYENLLNKKMHREGKLLGYTAKTYKGKTRYYSQKNGVYLGSFPTPELANKAYLAFNNPKSHD